MATDSSILAWRIPWTEEPGRLQSMGLQSWTQLKQLSACVHTHTHTRVRVHGKSRRNELGSCLVPLLYPKHLEL